jgi:hypothetical protein
VGEQDYKRCGGPAGMAPLVVNSAGFGGVAPLFFNQFFLLALVRVLSVAVDLLAC